MVKHIPTAPTLISDDFGISNPNTSLHKHHYKLMHQMDELKSLTLHNIFFNTRYEEENNEIHFPLDQDADLVSINNVYNSRVENQDAYISVNFGLDLEIDDLNNTLFYKFEVEHLKPLASQPHELDEIKEYTFTANHKILDEEKKNTKFEVNCYKNNKQISELQFNPSDKDNISYEIGLSEDKRRVKGNYNKIEDKIRNRFLVDDKMFLTIEHKNDLAIINFYFRNKNSRCKICSLPLYTYE
ncbi:hypothetical protein KBD45_05225 [Candidatus Dojkabacteria bacterium]|nr:hypothetical protein [Candidatus Dojkabacteria bacterium]